MKKCIAEGCTEPYSARGLCKKHYQKAYKRSRSEDPVAREEYNRKTREYQQTDEYKTRKRERIYGEAGVFERLWAEQEGKCAVCGTEMARQGRKGESAVVDHCHQTKAVRGLLHGRCNVVLGIMRESSVAVLGLVSYIERKCEPLLAKERP